MEQPCVPTQNSSPKGGDLGLRTLIECELESLSIGVSIQPDLIESLNEPRSRFLTFGRPGQGEDPSWGTMIDIEIESGSHQS